MKGLVSDILSQRWLCESLRCVIWSSLLSQRFFASLGGFYFRLRSSQSSCFIPIQRFISRMDREAFVKGQLEAVHKALTKYEVPLKPKHARRLIVGTHQE
ncbi:hypothetical protein NECAME_04060, partial [Necator americanus]